MPLLLGIFSWLGSAFGNAVAFFKTKLGKIVLAVIAAVALVWGAWYGVTHAIKKHDDAIRAEVRSEVTKELTEKALRDAEADRKFSEKIETDKKKDIADLNETKRDTKGKIDTIRSDIKQKAADGTVENGKASPLILDAIAQIDSLQQARKEAAQ